MLKHLITSVSLALTFSAVHAQSLQLSPGIVTTIKNLPVPSCNGTSWSNTFDSMRNGLQAVASSPNWYSTSAACGLSMFVVNPNPNQFAVWVVNNSTLKLSDLPFSQSGVWKDIADAQLSTTIFSTSTDDLDHLQVTNTTTPEAFRNFFVRGATYAGMTHLRVPQGGQIFTRAAIKGDLGSVLSDVFNLPTDNLWLQVEVTQETQALSLMLPKGQKITGPFGMEPVTLEDVTFRIEKNKDMWFMGNATFRKLPGKVLPLVLKSPALAGSWKRNLPGTSMVLNAPQRLTLNDYAKVILDLSTAAPQAASQGFLGDVMPTQEMFKALDLMNKPLGIFKLINPKPNADKYRLAAGQGTPDSNDFNFEIRGKTAPGGPLLRFNAEMEVFGQKLARSDTTVSKTSLTTNSKGGFNIGIPGLQNPSVEAIVDVGLRLPTIKLDVKSPGFNFTMGLDKDFIFANAKADCPLLIGLGGKIALTDELSADTVVKGLNVSLPTTSDMTKCAEKIGDLANDGLKRMDRVFHGGSWQSHPPRTTYDCTNFDENSGASAKKFIEAYPPARLWGSQSDFDNRRMGFARYIYSQKNHKFHPITEAALGGTACGGLVAEEGVGLGRLDTPTSSIWNRALFCERNKFPAHLVGALINNATACYEARGLSAPATALKGQTVRAAGDDTQSLYLIDQNGALRLIGWKDNWSVHQGCELGKYKLKENPISLHDLYKIPNGGPLTVASCKQVIQSMNIPVAPTTAQAFDKKFIANCDNFKNTHIVANGKRHWIGNKDKWNVFEGCRADTNEQIQCMSLEDVNSVPDGGAIGDVNQCRTLKGLAPIVPPPTVAQKFNRQFIANCDNFKNTHVVANGKRHWIGNKDKWNVFEGCRANANEQIQCMSLEDVNSVPDGGAIGDVNQCRSLRGIAPIAVAPPPPPPPPPPPSLAQQWRGQFVAYCDVYKNTHLIGNDGRRHWIANKDKWWVFNSCANGAPVRCVGLNEVMGIPEGAEITTAQQCNALK